MSTIKLPGLVDMHVHLRDPGQTEKEDFYTGTSAALAGGFTTVFDMPNNKLPITTSERLEEKKEDAKKKIVCDVGFYFGSLGENIDEFKKIKNKVYGLKLYLNQTTGGYIIDEIALKKIYDNWPNDSLILLHSEENIIDRVMNEVRRTGKRSHFCHLSSKAELVAVIQAKKDNLPVTCGVCPHHLFLTEKDVSLLGAFGRMKPELKSEKDRQFLWKNLKYVDVIESDHAPHTLDEKNSDHPPHGVPGLETTLPLLLKAADEKKLSIDRIIELCYTNQAHILGLRQDKNTYIEVDMMEYIIRGKDLKTKCGWTPFEGWKVKGRVKRVVLRGKKVYEDGKVLVKPGFGKVL
ncbi:MAG: amidohydrolase family protein [bacterium]|nr:amidohydrolase family protein [bacterium]